MLKKVHARIFLLSLLTFFLAFGCEQEDTFRREIEGWVGFGECFTFFDVHGKVLANYTVFVVRTESELDRLYQVFEKKNEGKSTQCKKPKVDFGKHSLVEVYFRTYGCDPIVDFNIEFNHEKRLCIVEVKFRDNKVCRTEVRHMAHFLVPPVPNGYSVKYSVN